MYTRIFNEVINASRNNALTIFVGAGISAISGAPSWSELLDAICEELGINHEGEYSSDDYLRIPQMFYYSLGKNEEAYLSFVKKHVLKDDLIPNHFHRELLNLNPVSFITTNYDSLIEDAAMQFCQGFKVVSQDSEIPSIYGDRYILKLHGDFVHKNIVLKEEDYLNYSVRFKLMETFMKAVFSTNTVVFIGYSLNDYNIKLILNWTKTMLGSCFRTPIFVYTGRNTLSEEEKVYQESKGLKVIDCKKLSDSSDFSDQYQAFFDELKACQVTSLNGISKDKAFNHLYDLLKPLDKLNSLRLNDITTKLTPHVYTSEDGVLRITKESSVLMGKFVSLYGMSKKKRDALPKTVQHKYSVILSVLKKARIGMVEFLDGRTCVIKEDLPFADQLCLMHDYFSMDTFVKKRRLSLHDEYKKAFYLSRLKRYDESFFLFSEVAEKAFKRKDYLLYYLSKSNCISLSKILSNVNRWNRCYDMETIDSLSPNEDEIENLFTRLPAEFRNNYSSLRDIYSPNMLYKYSYGAFVDGKKLLATIENNTFESGITSSGKVIVRINDYLNFLLGNGIIADEFSEYKNTVKNLMSVIVNKYAAQEKKKLRPGPFDEYDNSQVYFDEVDFFCFIKCFDSKELVSLFEKNKIDTIEFTNMPAVERIAFNLIDYYGYAVKNAHLHIEPLAIQYELRSCFALLRYVDISQELVEKTTSFLLENSFRNIMIDDKVLFLHFQLYRRKKSSTVTSDIVKKAFLAYTDKHIESMKENKSFEVLSSISSVNYYQLVHYISPEEKKHVIQDLSRRVSTIIQYNLKVLINPLIKQYWNYITPYQKRKVRAWLRELIDNRFSFDIFKALISSDANVEKRDIAHLKEYLTSIIQTQKNTAETNAVKVLTDSNPYDDLIQVGYWCFINLLKRDDFREFVGIDNSFDFYFLYDKYDFSKFDVSMILSRNKNALDLIAKNTFVRTKIREAIAVALKSNGLCDRDERDLREILMNHFC